jgi:hypothetical protein
MNLKPLRRRSWIALPLVVLIAAFAIPPEQPKPIDIVVHFTGPQYDSLFMVINASDASHKAVLNVANNISSQAIPQIQSWNAAMQKYQDSLNKVKPQH